MCGYPNGVISNNKGIYLDVSPQPAYRLHSPAICRLSLQFHLSFPVNRPNTMAVHRLLNPKIFFEEGNAAQFEFALSKYDKALALKATQRNKKPEELAKLDTW